MVMVAVAVEESGSCNEQQNHPVVSVSSCTPNRSLTAVVVKLVSSADCHCLASMSESSGSSVELQSGGGSSNMQLIRSSMSGAGPWLSGLGEVH